MIENPCKKEIKCDNCSNHFMRLRPEIKDFKITPHFERDIKNNNERQEIINKIISCSNIEHEEMHKFEKSIKGNRIFRAKINGVHILYSINQEKELVFLRAFKNFQQYGAFLNRIERFL